MEEKKYPVIGTVTISVEEYRDLITDVTAFKRDLDDYRSKYWCEQNKNKSLETSISAIKDDLQLARKFIDSKKEYRLAFKMFAAGVEDEDAE